MVDDLFELSRIHAGILSLTLAAHRRCGDVVSEALAGRRPGRADPPGRGRRRRRWRTSRCTADPAALSRVVGNLVMNAIRHTPADGVVRGGRAPRPARSWSCPVTDGVRRHRPEDDMDSGLRRRLAGHRGAHPGAGCRRRARAGHRQGPRRGPPRHGGRQQPRWRVPLPGPAARMRRNDGRRSVALTGLERPAEPGQRAFADGNPQQPSGLPGTGRVQLLGELVQRHRPARRRRVSLRGCRRG